MYASLTIIVHAAAICSASYNVYSVSLLFCFEIAIHNLELLYWIVLQFVAIELNKFFKLDDANMGLCLHVCQIGTPVSLLWCDWSSINQRCIVQGLDNVLYRAV